MVKRTDGTDAVEGGASHIVAAELDASGQLVSAFGSNGVKAVNLASGDSLATAIAVGGHHVYLEGEARARERQPR